MFFYKAELAGALSAEKDREEANALVTGFIKALGATGSNNLHVARQYSKMLQRMWQRKEQRVATYTPRVVESGAPNTLQGAPSIGPGISASETLNADYRSQDSAFGNMGESDSTVPEFTVPSLTDPDNGLVDLQILDNFAMQDFSDMPGPFDIAPMVSLS